MKKYLSNIVNSISLVLITGTVLAQQEYQFANTINNPFLLNPAAGGLTDVMQFEAGTRMQWLGYDGGPRTILFTGNSQISFKNKKVLDEFNVHDEKLFSGPTVTTNKTKHVVGGKVWNDAIGPFSKTSINASYAYHLPLTKTLNIGAGLGLGFSNFRLDPSKVVLHESDDNAYSQFLGNSSTQNMGDAQGGIVVYGEKLFFGLSASQLFNNTVQFDNVSTESNFNRHYFMVAKYKLDLSDGFAIEPNAIVKMTSNVPVSYDLGARALLNNSSWFGVQYRSSSSLVFQVGTNLVKNLYFCYAYESSMGKLRTSSNGTHEFHIGYFLGKNRNVDKEIKEKSTNSEKAE